MAEYLVEWTIDIEADTPEEAARKALDIQRNPDSIATYFSVISRSDTNAAAIRVDLLELVTDETTPGVPSLPRPRTSCGCGHDLVWVDGHWEHDVAPYIWGDDHDPDADEPDGQARVDWDLYDNGEF